MADQRVGRFQAVLLALGRLVVDFQKRIGLEHLLDFLRQLQGGELQKADRLLQLRRERQMLRDA